MASQAVRLGDINGGGGATMQGSTKVTVNGRPLCYTGVPVSPHAPCPDVPIHCSARTGKGSTKVLVEGIPVIRVGDVDTCGHSRATGSSNVIIG